ncbi:MAG TPA: glycosyltransferase family 39 protein, partial [Bacteroidales bacterium]
MKTTARNLNVSHWGVFAAALLMAFLLYGNTIRNQYCLDDAVVITRNSFVDQGFSGIPDIFSTESFTGFFGKQKELVSGSRYRPLSIATFAIEKQIFQGYKPSVSHFINILLFALTGFLMYLLLEKIVPGDKSTFSYIPIIATLLFMFHPVHTEVIANIKGRDEIMALLFSLAGCLLILRYNESKKVAWLITGTIIWFLGLLSKENAIVFWVLMPVILFLSGVRDTKKYLFPMLAFSVSAIVFLAVRHAVIGGATGGSDELMNDSFLQATADQKYATIFYTLWKYIGLLFFPVHLTYDYYPYHIALTDWGNILSLLGL